MAKFSERLRQLRTARDLSQSEFAKYIGVSKSSVNMYERGEREPGLETLETIADFFNVDLDYLLGKSDIISKGIYLFDSAEFKKAPADNGKSLMGGSIPNDENIIRIAGRDGSFVERRLTDSELAAFKALLDALPAAPDDL